MDHLEAPIEPPIEWLKLRKRTLVVFAIESLLIGMDFSLTFLTLWIYLKNLIKPENPELCYGLISAAYLVASFALSGFVGRIADVTRNVKIIFFVLNSVTILGNLLYAIPLSPWTLGIGRFLTGFCGPLRSVITGEVSRSHDPDSLMNVLSVMGVAFTVGFIAGPALNAACKDVHFYIYTWPITFANFPGIYMAAFFLCLQGFSFFFLSNISKIYDLKDELTNGRLRYSEMDSSRDHHNPCGAGDPGSAFCNSALNEETEVLKNTKDKQISYGTLDTEKERLEHTIADEDAGDHHYRPEEEQHLLDNRNLKPSVWSILKSLFTQFDTALLLCVSFIDGYFETTFELWVPMVVVDTLGWSTTSLSIIALWGGISTVGPCILLALVNLSNRAIYVIALLSFVSTGLMEGIFMALKEYTIDKIIVYVFWVMYGLMYAFLIVMGEVFLVGCLAKMVDSSVQTFVDSIRVTAYRLGSMMGLLTAALLFRWIHIVGWVHLAVILVSFVLILARRKSLMNPEIIIFGI